MLYDDDGNTDTLDPLEDLWRPFGHCDPAEDEIPWAGQRVEVWWAGNDTWCGFTLPSILAF